MIGSYLHPGNPMANMYFTLYGYNSNGQAYALMQDFKFAQYVKLPPRHLFAAQILGTFVGCIFNYIIMNQIVTNEAAILKSVEGTPIWSGQAPQQFNSQGIAWGALAKYLFSTGGRYWFVPVALAVGFFLPLPFYFAHRLFPRAGLQYVNVPILIWSWDGCVSEQTRLLQATSRLPFSVSSTSENTTRFCSKSTTTCCLLVSLEVRKCWSLFCRLLSMALRALPTTSLLGGATTTRIPKETRKMQTVVCISIR